MLIHKLPHRALPLFRHGLGAGLMGDAFEEDELTGGGDILLHCFGFAGEGAGVVGPVEEQGGAFDVPGVVDGVVAEGGNVHAQAAPEHHEMSGGKRWGAHKVKAIGHGGVESLEDGFGNDEVGLEFGIDGDGPEDGGRPHGFAKENQGFLHREIFPHIMHRRAHILGFTIADGGARFAGFTTAMEVDEKGFETHRMQIFRFP